MKAVTLLRKRGMATEDALVVEAHSVPNIEVPNIKTPKQEAGRRSPYAELLAIMLTVLAALLGYGSLERPLSAGTWTLAQPDLPGWKQASTPTPREALARQIPGSEPVANSSEEAQQILPPANTRAPSLTTDADVKDVPKQRVLMLGDSMIESLQQRAAAYFKRTGHHFTSVIWYGSRTIDWGSTSRLREVLHTYAPTYVMVVLGSNELTARNIERRAGSVRRIDQILSDRCPYVWVGPPNWRDDTGLNALLQRETGKRLFVSKDLDLARKSDGIHPTDSAGIEWMDLIAPWMVKHPLAPLPLGKPDSDSGRHAPARVWPPPSR